VKIPRWISNFTGKQLEFDVVAGLDALPRHIKEYSFGYSVWGCMITRKQLINRCVQLLKPEFLLPTTVWQLLTFKGFITVQ